jgi:ribosomal protein S18 acetylase RimI-like enzyme
MESSNTRSNNESLEIVRATAAHAEAVAPLFDAYRQFYGLRSDVAAARAFLSERLARDESVVFLALLREGGAAARPVGFTQLYPSFSSLALRPVWILYDLFVAPDARRYGVGRALLERAHAFAIETGAAELSLQTARDNLPAQALYARLGWRRDDEFLTYVLPV